MRSAPVRAYSQNVNNFQFVSEKFRDSKKLKKLPSFLNGQEMGFAVALHAVSDYKKRSYKKH